MFVCFFFSFVVVVVWVCCVLVVWFVRCVLLVNKFYVKYGLVYSFFKIVVLIGWWLVFEEEVDFFVFCVVDWMFVRVVLEDWYCCGCVRWFCLWRLMVWFIVVLVMSCVCLMELMGFWLFWGFGGSGIWSCGEMSEVCGFVVLVGLVFGGGGGVFVIVFLMMLFVLWGLCEEYCCL